MPEYAPNVRQEAHVQHAIRLVQNQVLQSGQGRVPLLKVIEQAPRRGDNHVDPSPKRFHLRTHSHAAEDGRGLDSCMAR